MNRYGQRLLFLLFCFTAITLFSRNVSGYTSAETENESSISNPLGNAFEILFIALAAGGTAVLVHDTIRSFEAVKEHGVAFSTTSAAAVATFLGVLAGAVTFEASCKDNDEELRNHLSGNFKKKKKRSYPLTAFIISGGVAVGSGVVSYAALKKLVNVSDDSGENEFFRVFLRTSKAAHGLSSFAKQVDDFVRRKA